MPGKFAVTKRILLKLEFCGADFCGWQLQSESVESQSKRSLQFCVESAVATMLGRHGERHTVQGCGRTDSGVHALEYYAHFDVHQGLESRVRDLAKFVHALNGVFPRGITALGAWEVPLDFHALKSAAYKVYEYRLFVRGPSPVIHPGFMYWLSAEIDAPPPRRNFDLAAVTRAARSFVGTHDFAALASFGSEVKSTVRTVSKIEILREKFPHHDSAGDLLRFRVWGNGFLKQMVRNMVGTLIEVGLAKRDEASVARLLEPGLSVRKDAGACAPAEGLFLSRVVYEHPAFVQLSRSAESLYAPHLVNHEVIVS
ncbi:MAG TPA: tRNA pseudouridine synthase A [Bdellovibrionota bacterium]|jgi:tRNA pseudouridine38-40 synthase|nr:tRNA pseudouridine synthase A [Bdellovibrionota bacterium]